MKIENEKIGKYRIVERVGEGGMGVVYRAFDEQLERPVALKFLSASGMREGSERLLREARAASALNHPNVMTVFEIGEHEGVPFIATELIEGQTLAERIKGGRLEVDFALACARQLAEGLKSAHARGIIHRDIKPANIMVTPDGRIKIMDFGLALIQRGKERLTQTGGLLGTAVYMSPEQIAGRPVDHRTDIFSLGVVLYEMFAGHPPFEGDYEVAIMYSILHTEPRPLAEAASGIPEGVSDLVGRCLRKSPEERFADCDELLACLAGLQGAKSAGRASVGEAGDVRLAAPAFPAPATELIGRTEELVYLRRVLQDTAAGRGTTVFIRGESGVGKSSLVGAVAKEAHAQGMTTLWGQGLFQEAGLPYHPFAGALRGAFQDDGNRMLELFAQKGAARGTPLAGRLAYLRAFLRISSEPVSMQNKEQLWDAILLLVKVMAADRPVLFVLDDMQWADRESIGLFSYAARNIADVPVLLIGIYRSEVSGRQAATDPSMLVEAIRQLKIEGRTAELDLGRLSAEETQRLVQQTLNNAQIDSRLAQRMYTATGGNPLFASELANLLKQQGAVALAGDKWAVGPPAASLRIPERVHEVIAQRLAGLSAAEREVLEFASCEGQHFASDTLATCLRIDRLTLLRQLQTLEKKHALIRYENGRYGFDCPLVRQVLYDGILPELREEYHRMIADWMIAHAAGDAEDASQVAHHLLASRQDAAAPPYLLRAADHARSLWANAEALEYYRQAHAILTRQGAGPTPMLLQVEEGLGDIALASGGSQEASAHFARMLELARTLDDPPHEIGALRKGAESLRILGRSDEALGLCTDALERARALDLSGEQTECLNTLAFIRSAKGEYEQSIQLSEEALALARSHADTRNAATSLSNLGFARMHRGEYQAAADRLTEARALQEYIGDRKGLALTLNYLALVHHRLGHFETALDVAQASHEIKKSIGDAAAIPGTINAIGDIYRDMGNIDAAVKHHRQSLQLARQQGNRGSECDNLRDLGADSLVRGELEEAHRYLKEVLAIARKHGYTWYETRSCITLAEYYLLAGSLEEAATFSERGRAIAETLKAKELIIEAEWKDALIQDRRGRHEEAATRLRGVIERAVSSGNLPLLWPMYRDLAGILERSGDHAGSVEARADAARNIGELAAGIQDQTARKVFLDSTGLAVELSHGA